MFILIETCGDGYGRVWVGVGVGVGVEVDVVAFACTFAFAPSSTIDMGSTGSGQQQHLEQSGLYCQQQGPFGQSTQSNPHSEIQATIPQMMKKTGILRPKPQHKRARLSVDIAHISLPILVELGWGWGLIVRAGALRF